MCGIAGLWLRDAASRPDTDRLWSMIHMLKHRGPDYQQVWEDRGVGLAHARLSILDLNPRSHQPMVDPDTDTVIVFNGEIYNYIELRSELRELGHTFRTESDTEVIPKAFRQWGVDCLPRFNGMWAFALIDRREKKLFCARDRYGIKPFCYGYTKTEDLVFASEHKALWTHFPELSHPNKPFVENYLDGSVALSPYRETFYKNIFHLLPGHYAFISNGEPVEQHPYYRVNQKEQDPLPSLEDAHKEFTHLLEDSLRLRYRSDVPVGSCMSGGLDSPTLVGLATRLFSSSLYTFSCIYPQYPEVDESQYIEASAKHFQSIAATTSPEFDDFPAAVRQITWEQDGPTGTPSILSQRAVMELARPSVRVLIDGQGADEVLGGYHSYFTHKIRALAREFARSLSWKDWKALREDQRRQEERTGSRNEKRLWKWIRRTWLGKTYRFQTLDHGFACALELQHPYRYDDLNSIMLEGVRTSMVDLLHYEDRNSMAFSIETRLPYLDFRLVDLAFSLPHPYKIKGEQTKVLLHHAARSVLPESVYHRRDKMGFSTPGQHWFRRKDCAERINGLLSSSGHPVYEYLEEKRLRKIKRAWEKCLAGEALDYGDESGLWKFLTTADWLEILSQGGSAFVQSEEPG